MPLGYFLVEFSLVISYLFYNIYPLPCHLSEDFFYILNFFPLGKRKWRTYSIQNRSEKTENKTVASDAFLKCVIVKRKKTTFGMAF